MEGGGGLRASVARRLYDVALLVGLTWSHLCDVKLGARGFACWRKGVDG